MALNVYYLPPDKTCWQGRTDAPENAYFFQKMRLLNLMQAHSAEKSLSFALLGFCCDEGIRRNFGRVGAKQGPDAIRQMLANIAFQRDEADIYDAGNIICIDEDLEGAQAALADAVLNLLQRNIIPIVIGGGHELAWGHYQGLRKQFGQQTLGIINFDAHFDMRPLLAGGKGSSGTPFLQIALDQHAKKLPFHYHCIGIQPESNILALIETAKHHHVKILWAQQLQLEKNLSIDFVDQAIAQNEYLYISLCLDVFAQAYAPGVSAPQAFGIEPWQMIPLLRQFAACQKAISYDIAELSPPYDLDHKTARLAANLIYEIIHHHQLRGKNA